MAIGFFDGLHIGHQAVIGRTIASARSVQGGLAVAVTFDRHPASVTAPDRAPLLIQTLDQKLRTLAGLGLNATWLIRFDKTFSKKAPEDFVSEMVENFPGVRAVFVGEKFRFGKQRLGTVELLQELGHRFGFGVEPIPPVMCRGNPVSSTRIRHLISAGHLDQAMELLGRPYALAGTIVEGDRFGRQLGYPTANLKVEGLVLPPHGVYAAHAEVRSWSGPAVVNIGFRPTLQHQAPVLRVEAHLIGFEGEIYGQEIELSFLRFLRSERRFETTEALRAQIAEDCRTAVHIHTDLWQRIAGKTDGMSPAFSTLARPS